MPRRSKAQRRIGIGRFDNHTGIDGEIAAWQIGRRLSKSIRQGYLRPSASPGESAVSNINRIDGVAS
jgi:hypothetical protein